MKLFCDDGSTNVKLAWFEAGTLITSVSVNSFRNGWKVDGLGSRKTYNYSLDGHKYTYDPVSEAAISTTHIEYQYTDSNVLAVHHALLNSGLEPQEISLTVTLPISEYYTADCQKNELNIERKIKNLLRPVNLNKGEAFTITSVDVMPESLPAVFTRLVSDNVGEFEKSLVIDLGGTTLDVGVIVGQFDDVSAVHGNSKIGVCQVTNATLTALRMASSDTSPMIADELIKKRHDATFFSQVVNDESKQSLVRDTIETAIHKLGEHVVDDLTKFRNVNRVYIVGGGATLIAPAVSKFWAHLGDKVVLMDEPQTALVKAIARFKGE
ncbi:plasmid segregation protein ParM domain-containing protein [Serratia sp. 14-2641]|uniref:plasmid segregation protein ParM domain-containing protein n=1 Tax=Serratia sp. 14-2641 TaxID=1841657 RepID=UPI00080FE121|nr:plasmid segregation protein ParM domain-containing protein [Serratia sp. 14-2641]OCJ37369.1 StbA family protein [Serratia sp. 14-2641]